MLVFSPMKVLKRIHPLVIYRRRKCSYPRTTALGYIQDFVGSPLMDPLKYMNHDVSYIPGYPYTMRDVVSPPRRYIFIGLLPVLCLTSNNVIKNVTKQTDKTNEYI